MINQVYNFLAVLMELIILEQEKTEMIIEDKFSYKKFLPEILPSCKTRRTKIITKISGDQIFDFCFSNDEQNDFILTKDGVFKINNQKDDQIEFEPSNLIKIDFDVSEFDVKMSKIAFSNGILYLFDGKTKTIHSVVVSEDEEYAKKEAEIRKKLDNAKNHSEKNRTNTNEQTKAIKNENTKKKIREKEKKEKRQKRKAEKLQIEKIEFNNQTVKVNLPDFQVLSVGCYDNYFQIVQRKNCNEDKTTVILTIIDLEVNNRIGYNIEEAFQSAKENIKQTQVEIEVEHKQTKMKDVFFSKDYFMISFENSSIQQWMIYSDGRAELFKQNISPFANIAHSKLKMDNKSILYSQIPIENENEIAISITKTYLPETNYCINNENSLFLSHPYLQGLSNIVDNCSQLILNYKFIVELTVNDLIDDESNKLDIILSINKTDLSKFKLQVSPNEMSFMNQSLISSSTQLESIKFLIKEIKDEKIKQFFIILMIRIIGIGFFYDINRNFSSSSIDERVMKVFKSYKSFILDLYSLSSSFSSTVFDIMLRESLMITIFIGGKYLFIPDSYEELHDFMKQLLSSPCSQSILRCLANFMFSLPSSLYIIDQTVYEHLLKIKHEIDINSLFIKNSSFIQIEDIYTTQTNDKIIEFISPYIQTLFKHFSYILNDESTPITFVEELFASIMSFDIGQIDLSLIFEKELVGISKAYYECVRKIPEVIESENEFNDFNVDYKTQEVIVGVKVIESQHPYNLDPLPIRKSPKDEKKNKKDEKKSKKDKKKSENHKKSKNSIYIDLGTVDFGENVNKIYIKFDPQSNIYENDAIAIYKPFGYKVCLKKLDDTYHIYSNKVRIAIIRSIDKQPKENKPFWGVKVIISGVYSNKYEWKPNKHLNIFNCFIYNLSHVHQKNFYSTSVTDSEKDFRFIMNDRFIQGINLDDIQNYEESLKSGQDDTNNNSRKMSRGISRGISYDSETKSDFDDKIKKDFINGIITAPQNKSTQYKRFLDCIYTKSSKRSFLKPNEEILEIERYFAACLFKQLGLITMCLNFSKIVSVTPKNDFKNIEVPNRILDIWKKNIYPLRNKLHFAFQRSNSENNNSNTDSQSFIYNFKEYSEEIKNKCIVLLYSDPILKFKDKGNLSNELFESTMKSIFSFVTSKTALKDITKIIEIQRKRLNYSSQSLSNIITFVDQNSLFNSSKTIFSLAYDCISIDNICQGLSQRELDEYKNLLGLLSVKYVQNIFVKPSLPMVLNIYYLCMLTCTHKDNDSQIKCSKMIIDVLELNKDNKSSFRHRINFSLVLILTLIAIQSKNKDLSNYLVSLLSKEDLDSESKVLLLIMIPFLIQVFHENSNLLDESIIFTILENNKDNPSVTKYMFYWLSSLFTLKDMTNHRDFIVKVFKGIGQSFIGKSCLFIDDSFKPLSHRQVSETMISFIRLLFNSKNELLFSVIHDILTNNLKDINEQKEEEMFILIGLFASLGSSVSAMEPNRFILNGIALNLCYGIKGYCRSGDEIKLPDYPNEFDPINTNVVLLKYVDFSLNDKEIDNILQIHESILHSKHFNGKENVFKNDIDDREITENILISTFYSFLSIIMQNVNNMNILLNEKNIKRTLSLCEISNQTVPSNTNSILLLSHYLEQAITSTLYNETNSDNILNDSIKFMKMNYGEIIYGKENDIIKTNKNYVNVFLCNRIFDCEKETYFNLKVDNINSHSIFIGFIDAEENEFKKSFGFGTTLHDEYLYRKTSIEILNDEISINDVKSIGCYYTKKYVYLLINECLTPYRVSHPTLMSYIPIIYVNCDELKVQILQNVTIVDHSNDKFNFLNIDQIPEEKYEEKDIKKIRNQIEQIDDMLNNADVKNDHRYFMIGQEINVNVITPEPLSSEAKDFPNSLSRIFYYKNQNGVIKDISTVDDNEFTVNINGLIYNRNTLSNEKFDLESKYISFFFTKFFNIVENRINTRFGLNSSMSVKHLRNIPDDLNSIRKYVKWKTINDNSKSIAIIMSRYLVFILLDYLRFSKSNLLQEEGINSNESQIIINALAHSLPTITLFSSSFIFKFANENRIVADDYLIFQDEQTEKTENSEEQQNCIKPFFKIAGNYQFFNVV